MTRSQAVSVGAELLAPQRPAGDLLHEPVMGVPDGSAPAAMPTADVETAAALRLETVREDGEMLEAFARPEQVVLRRPGAESW